jgi:hydroxymethylbilane synthase
MSNLPEAPAAMPTPEVIHLATRGSSLALAQANQILAQCRAACPEFQFAIKIIKTTGDKNLTASLANPGALLPKGLFTKELEVALLNGEADLAVHSLKDLPTELPDGLKLGATPMREDPRDVLVFPTHKIDVFDGPLPELPEGATIATSSNRRKAQLLRLRPDFTIVEIRGNVGTRLRKVKEQPELHATVLAAAGLKRLGFTIEENGALAGDDVPEGIQTRFLTTEEMLPCVGQAAIGIETRENDPRIDAICDKLNHSETLVCVTAERAFLRTTGGGCSTPVAALAEIREATLSLRANSFIDDQFREFAGTGAAEDAAKLGADAAAALK